MKKYYSLLIFCYAILIQSVSYGQVILTDTKDNYLIEKDLEVLPDSLGILTIEEVSSPEYAHKFQKGYNNLAWLNKTQYKAHWLKLEVENKGDSKEWLLGINGRDIQLFDLQLDTNYKTGFLLPKKLVLILTRF
jgi:hypothetical protein